MLPKPEVFYRLRFGGPIEWERVTVSDGFIARELHLSERMRRALSLPDGAWRVLQRNEA